MTDDELLASLPAEALILFREKWGRGGPCVECPTRESWNYACMLQDRGLLEMHHELPPYFSLTERGERLRPAVDEFLRARKAMGGQINFHESGPCRRQLDCDRAKNGRCVIHGVSKCPDCNC